MINTAIIRPNNRETKFLLGSTPKSKGAKLDTWTSQPNTTLSPELESHHREHLLSEGFTEQEIETLTLEYNVRSLTEAEALDMGFKVWDGDQWKSSSGIYFPFTESFGQLRADDPIKRKNGKPAKYLTQAGKASEAFIPAGCVAVTEGFKDALMATLRGVPTGAMAGVSHYKKALPQRCGYTIVFDSDGWVNPQVFHNLIKAGIWCKGKVLILDPMSGYPKGGLCELYQSGEELDLSKAVKPLDLLLGWPSHWEGLPGPKIAKLADKAVKLATEYLPESEADAFINRLAAQHRGAGLRTRPLQRIKKRVLRKIAADEPTPYQQDYNTVLNHLSERIRLNEVTKRWELDGSPFSPDSVRNLLMIEHGLKLKTPKDGLIDIVQYIAESNSYNPIQDYLNSVYEKYKDRPELLQQSRKSLAQRYLGTADPTSDVLLRKTLIAAIARAFEPGCKVDTSTVLVGAQGIRKSTFWKAIASPTYFCDDFSDIANKDHILKLHNNWIIEWSELDGLSRKEVTHLKAFMATSSDLIRAPYARSAEYLHRPSIIVGTTNESEFLTDATGNRRWWIIDCGSQPIDVEAVERDRDLIWASAMHAYLNEESWWLSSEQEKELETARKQYQKFDAWHSSIAEYLEDKNQVSISEIFDVVLQMEPSKQGNSDQGRIIKILKMEGFENYSTPICHQYQGADGPVKKKQRVWVRKEPLETPSTQDLHQGQRDLDLGTAGTAGTSLFHRGVPPKLPAESGFQAIGTPGTPKNETFEDQTQNIKNESPQEMRFIDGQPRLVRVHHGDI